MNTPGSNDITKDFFEGFHLKRIPITIQSKKNPDHIVAGYALSHEILAKQISFFAPQKFPVDEELTVSFDRNGEKQSSIVTMKHMHEQISSGRIMNALPTEGNPFPARKFYRCYSFVVMDPAKVNSDQTTNDALMEVKAETMIESQAEGNSEKVVETPAAEKKSDLSMIGGMDAFTADEIVPTELPEVGDIAPADLDELKAA